MNHHIYPPPLTSDAVEDLEQRIADLELRLAQLAALGAWTGLALVVQGALLAVIGVAVWGMRP